MSQVPPSCIYDRRYKGPFPHLIDYRDWEDATPEQRRAWNCALDLALNKESGPKAAPVAPEHIAC